MEEKSIIEPPKVRCVALIDGFNLYHAIDDCPHYHGYKWLNLDKLCTRLLESPAKESLLQIYYFTAVPPWSESKKARHLNLIGIYQDIGIRVIHGKFLPTTAHCRLCDKIYDTHQEKMTDINITLEMLKIGHENTADRIYLITGDNDQAAGILRFRSLYPDKEVYAVIPPHRRAKSLTGAATKKLTISETHLKESLLDDPHVFKDGRKYHKPQSWANGKHPGPNWRPREEATKKYH